jgi:medium-chain acyl-[acyl-carrier-protein] hydrolase
LDAADGTRAGPALYCFPYAGATAAMFRDFAAGLPAGVEVRAVERPGRGARAHEPFARELRAVVDEAADLVERDGCERFALYGHSLGALTAFELARELRRRGGRQPFHLVVSAARAPHLAQPERFGHRLPDAELLEAVRRLDGTPAAILDDPALWAHALPALRADFEVFETYRHLREQPLEVPITAIAGLRDRSTPPSEIAAWKEHTVAPFAMHVLAGGHFVINTQRRRTLQLIGEVLVDGPGA